MGLKETSLIREHVKLGAKLGAFSDYNMPLQYSTVKQEVHSVRNKVGMFDVSHMGEFIIEGNDTEAYIDSLICNDYGNLSVGKAIYSPLCRENGTVIDDLIVYKLGKNKALVCVNASNIEKDYNWFETHKTGFDINLADESLNYSLIAVQGPKTLEALKKIDLGFDETAPYYSVQLGKLNGEELILARTGYTGEDGFEIFGGHAVIGHLWRHLIDQEVEPCGLVARDVLRLEVCYPLYGNELSDDLTPLDSGLKWTVKIHKPNYLGKEALSNGHPAKFKLIKFSIEQGIPRKDYEILNSNRNKVGSVTSGGFSPTTGYGIGMALVEQSLIRDSDEKFFIKIRDKEISLNITKKPFVIGSHL